MKQLNELTIFSSKFRIQLNEDNQHISKCPCCGVEDALIITYEGKYLIECYFGCSASEINRVVQIPAELVQNEWYSFRYKMTQSERLTTTLQSIFYADSMSRGEKNVMVTHALLQYLSRCS